jgi:hypothetical protein
MEMSQESPCVAFLNEQNVIFLFFYKIRTVLSGEIGTSEREKDVGKGCGRMNMMQIQLYMYVHGKMILVETVPGMRERGE